MAPLLDAPLRAAVHSRIKISDASPTGVGVVECELPIAAAAELWRHRIRPSAGSGDGDALLCSGVQRGDDAVGELLESCVPESVLAFRFNAGRAPHINVGEARARRALWKQMSTDLSNHQKRHLVAYDSSVTVGASVKGRSPSGSMIRELQLTGVYILAMDCVEGALWCESEHNLADSPSRQGPLPIPAPRREWVHKFLQGDAAAFVARREGRLGRASAGSLEGRARADSVEPFRDNDDRPYDGPEESVDAFERTKSDVDELARLPTTFCRTSSGRSARTQRFDSTRGFPGEGPPKGRGRRAKSAPPRTQRRGVDLRVAALGAESTASRRTRLVADLEGWLAEQGHPTLGALVETVPVLDNVLKDYGQFMYSNDYAQGDFVETLNAVRARYEQTYRQLRGAWSLVTAWQLLEPGRNHAPVPPVLARALTALFLIWGWMEIAALVCLGFEAALRPGDLLFLTRRDLRFSTESGRLDRCVFVILRHSKTSKMKGARWQHVRLDSVFVIALLWGVFGNRAPDAPLFSFIGSATQRARRLTVLFQAGLAALGVPIGDKRGYVLSGLRAGGITAFFQHTQDMMLTRWRGRWDSLRTLEHYIQELPMAEQFARLPADVRTKLARLSGLLPVLTREAELNVLPPV